METEKDPVEAGAGTSFGAKTKAGSTARIMAVALVYILGVAALWVSMERVRSTSPGTGGLAALGLAQEEGCRGSSEGMSSCGGREHP